eukprot:2354677-Alexandrium_andersonii.AAC.1
MEDDLLGGPPPPPSRSEDGPPRRRSNHQPEEVACSMPDCEGIKKKGSRFCAHHTRHQENMRYQAEKESTEQLAAFDTQMSSLDVAIEEIQRFASANAAVPR